MEHDILGFEVVVDDFVRERVQIPNCVNHLFNDHFRLFLWYFLMFFQIVGQVWALTVLKDRTKWIIINFYCIIKLDNIGMKQGLMNRIFPQSMLDIVFLGTAVPIGMELMYFTGNLSHLLNIEGFIYLTEASFAQQSEELILFYPYPVRNTSFRVYLPVLGMLLLEWKFVFLYMQHFLLIKSL